MSRYSQKQRIIDYRVTFGSEHGRRVLSDLVRECHALEPSHVRGEPHETAFREGERNVLLKIITALSYKPEDFINQAKESAEND